MDTFFLRGFYNVLQRSGNISEIFDYIDTIENLQLTIFAFNVDMALEPNVKIIKSGFSGLKNLKTLLIDVRAYV